MATATATDSMVVGSVSSSPKDSSSEHRCKSADYLPLCSSAKERTDGGDCRVVRRDNTHNSRNSQREQTHRREYQRGAERRVDQHRRTPRAAVYDSNRAVRANIPHIPHVCGHVFMDPTRCRKEVETITSDARMNNDANRCVTLRSPA
jgi:hypothetical protein